MKKLFLIISMLFILSLGFGQKVKIKKENIFVNNTEYMTYEKESKWYELNSYIFYNLSNEVIAYSQAYEYNDPEAIEPSNTKGRVIYYKISFEGVDGFFEMNDQINSLKTIARLLYKNKILVDDKINIEKAKSLINRKGKPHTRRRKEITEEKSRIIIIK